MQGPTERPDPATLRVSDQDRHKVTELLRLAAGEGRIDLEELDDRLEAAYAAKTYAELVPITADLPALPASGAATYATSFAVVSESKRRGQWLVPEEHTAVSLMGTVLLDLREAAFATPDVTINAYAIMGEVKIVVNARTRVVVDGVALMADFSEGRDKVPAELAPDSPTVRVKGLALMGNVKVQRRDMPGKKVKRR